MQCFHTIRGSVILRFSLSFYKGFLPRVRRKDYNALFKHV